MATTNVSAGQSQTQNPTDPTLTALQLQQQELAAQQAVMDARLKMQQDQQNMLTGSLPSSTTTPNTGAFTVSGSNPFPSQKLAYDSLSELAQTVAEKLSPSGGVDLIGAGPVLLYDQSEINSLINYKAVVKVLTALQTQVTKLQQDFTSNLDKEAKRLLKTDLTVAPAAATVSKDFAGILAPGFVLAGLKTVSDLIGMFRTNTNIAFSSFTADDVALAAAVADKLKAKSKIISQPASMPLAVTDGSSPFMDQLALVQTTLLNLQDTAGVDQAQIQQLSDALNIFIQADQVLKAANGDQTKTPGLTATRDAAQQYAAGLLGIAPSAALDIGKANILKAQCDQFLKSIAGFVTAVTTAASAFGALQTSLTAISNSGSATLTAILRAEKLMDSAKTAGATILTLKTSILAGSVVTKTNLFRGGTLIFTGGAIATFTLFDIKGSVLASGLAIGESKEDKRTF